MTSPITAAVAQFEARDGGKRYNLDVIEQLSAGAARRGAQLILFHELSVTGYTFLENLSREEVTALAGDVPGGSMIIDPFGEIAVECRSLEDEAVCAALMPGNLQLASGASYIRARRPDLYSAMVSPNPRLAPSKRPEVYWQKIRETQQKT